MTHKIYLENSYLKEITATIVSKEARDNKYYIKLDRTIFYPHLSGGQPRDRGTINEAQVLDVYEDGPDIVHIVNKDILDKHVKLTIEWDNRFDLMQQHTGQHLLSSSFHKLLGAETLSFHMGRDYVSIDIKRPDLTEEEVEQIEYLTNKIIHSNFEIKTYLVNNNDIPLLPLRKMPSVTENIRIVEIENVDYAPCGGTHLSFTGEIGLIKIIRWERYKGNTRVGFVCGNRALRDYSWKSKYINDIGLMLSSKDKDVFRKASILIDQKSKLEKENRELREELRKYKAELYYKDLKSINKINYIIKYLEDTNLKDLSFIASHLNEKSNLIQIYGVNNKDIGQFLISKSKDLDIDLKVIFNDISQSIVIRGGGSPQLIQGGTSISNLDDLIKMFYKRIRNYYKG